MKRASKTSKAFRIAYAAARGSTLLRIVTAAGLVFLLLLLSCLFIVLLAIDIAKTETFFEGIKVAGVPVGNLTRPQAEKLIKKSVTEPLMEKFTLRLAGRTFTISPEDIGMEVDQKKMLDEAYWAWRGKNVFERMAMRFLNIKMDKDVPVRIKYDTDALKRKIREIAEKVNRRPVSAFIDISSGSPVIRGARYGLKVDEEAVVRDMRSALPTSKRDLEIRAMSLKPDITENDIDKIVVVKLGEHKLYLYDKQNLLYVFTVAVGSPQYPTPTGKFYIRKKEKNPTWYPPKSDWAKDQKPIPPGPGNPLGPYWLEIGNGIGIHSTPDEASLGYSVSHGCIRISEWGAYVLFNAVKVGTPVFILP